MSKRTTITTCEGCGTDVIGVGFCHDCNVALDRQAATDKAADRAAEAAAERKVERFYEERGREDESFIYWHAETFEALKRAGQAAAKSAALGDPVPCSGCGCVAEFLDLVPGASGLGVFCLDCIDGKPIYEDPSSCLTARARAELEAKRRLGNDLARIAGLGRGGA